MIERERRPNSYNTGLNDGAVRSLPRDPALQRGLREPAGRDPLGLRKACQLLGCPMSGAEGTNRPNAIPSALPKNPGTALAGPFHRDVQVRDSVLGLMDFYLEQPSAHGASPTHLSTSDRAVKVV